MNRRAIDAAATGLRASSRAFTPRNLFHAVRRLVPDEGLELERFVAGPLQARLRRGPIPGLLLPSPTAADERPLPREWDNYFPAAILIVDRRALVDLFAASGVVVQARLAVVCVDGTPAPIVRWLCRGLRRGFRAPVGYLHDSATVIYPFGFEPLKTFVSVLGGSEPLVFRDLGLPPRGLDASSLPFAPGIRGVIREVEEAPPASMVAWVARQLGAMLPADPWLAPLAGRSP